MRYAAEQFALPSYKWIGERRFVTNMQSWRISQYPGGIGFSFYNYAETKALKVLLKAYREDGSCERFLLDTYYCGEWGDNWQKWQTHQLPLFPYESCHGLISHITFSYLIHKDGRSIPSRYDYKFATLADFHHGCLELSDFHDPDFKRKNSYETLELNSGEIQRALDRINGATQGLPVRPYFTRGNTADPTHPLHEIHRQTDLVIERKQKDPGSRHFIQLAIFDFDNYHVAEHLIHAREKGVEVECVADWSAVSSMNCTENIARMRRAGIPIIGVVRNTPGDPSQGIASMHTKIIIFDNAVVHCSSYNLHFHLWGGNWEQALFYYSRDFALLYANIYHAIRGGVNQETDINPRSRFNLLYSFGRQRHAQKALYRPQDAIIDEITNANTSIIVSMFDIGQLTGIAAGADHETDVITALITARDRGVRVTIILNGMTAHTGTLPDPWDLSRWRPLKKPVQRLKDAWMEIIYVYYRESVYSPLHHKFAVFDSHTVITGSYNWYEASVYSDEVLTVIRDRTIANAFIDEAHRLCTSFRAGYE
jgi:phosphatidylserine/phosphatidylglycerophosphate/cardiolipin synthase-like enzyme